MKRPSRQSSYYHQPPQKRVSWGSSQVKFATRRVRLLHCLRWKVGLIFWQSNILQRDIYTSRVGLMAVYSVSNMYFALFHYKLETTAMQSKLLGPKEQQMHWLEGLHWKWLWCMCDSLSLSSPTLSTGITCKVTQLLQSPHGSPTAANKCSYIFKEAYLMCWGQ